MFSFQFNKNIFRSFLGALILYNLSATTYAVGEDKVISVIAAENMYGNIAQQLGGNHVKVDSILNNPDQDPHLFELTPSIGKKIADANLIVINGLGYDSWMNRLLTKYHFDHQDIISVELLLNCKEGDNPHLWYDIHAIEALSQQLQEAYSRLDPQQKIFFTNQLGSFKTDLEHIKQRVQQVKKQYPHIKVAATEPVFGLMAQQLGFDMLEEPYQWVVMNGGEPTPKQIGKFIQDLKSHQIQILFYNDQVATPATQQLKNIATQAGIPVVGVSETMPVDLTYQQWINQVLDKVEAALKDMPQ